MGTLQTELKKITSLDNLKFDDDPQDSPAPAVALDENVPHRQRIWAWAKAHPGSTSGQIAAAMGLPSKFVSAAMNHFSKRGWVTRETVDDVLHFTVTTDKYPAIGSAERAQIMLAARKHLGKTRGKGKKTKAKQAQAKTAAPVRAPAQLPVVNSIDDIINHLSVMQARELYDKLHKIFGG